MAKTPELLMIGGGGHARVVQEVLREAGHELYGYVAPDENGLKISSSLTTGQLDRFSDEEALGFDPEDFLLINGLGSTSDLTLRASVFEKYKAAGFNFLQTSAQTSHISGAVHLLEGVQVMHMAVVHTLSIVHENTIINTGAIVEHDNIIGAHSHISVGAVLCGNVSVGERTHIGANATILQGVKIGSNCIIGAGAVVLHDVPDNHVAVGVPAVAKKRG